MKRTAAWLILLALTVSALLGCGQKTATATETAVCKHPAHDPETGICTTCGEVVSHHYVDGKCTGCEKTTEFLWEDIASKTELMDILKAGGSEKKGTIERMTYQTLAYNIQALTGEEKIIEKEAFVYLPYGYDAGKPYNLLVLQHGSGEDAGYWFARGKYAPDDLTAYQNTGNYTQELLDYLIAEGLCEPCIVVTPTFYNDPDNKEEENVPLMALFGHEVVEYLLPAVMERYSTYASDLDEVIANREHFAYAGLSRGSRVSFDSIMTYCLPYFAYVGSFSSPASDSEGLVAALNGEYKAYEIRYWWAGVGDKDKGADRYSLMHKTYETLTSGAENLTDGVNCAMVDIYKAAHTYECWLTCLYNALPKFFR